MAKWLISQAIHYGKHFICLPFSLPSSRFIRTMENEEEEEPLLIVDWVAWQQQWQQQRTGKTTGPRVYKLHKLYSEHQQETRELQTWSGSSDYSDCFRSIFTPLHRPTPTPSFPNLNCSFMAIEVQQTLFEDSKRFIRVVEQWGWGSKARGKKLNPANLDARRKVLSATA